MAFLIERAQNEKEQLRVFFFSYYLVENSKNGEVRDQMRDSTHTRERAERGGIQHDNRQQKGRSETDEKKKKKLNLCLTVSCESRGEIKKGI